jgi:hypothetical protein
MKNMHHNLISFFISKIKIKLTISTKKGVYIKMSDDNTLDLVKKLKLLLREYETGLLQNPQKKIHPLLDSEKNRNKTKDEFRKLDKVEITLENFGRKNDPPHTYNLTIPNSQNVQQSLFSMLQEILNLVNTTPH